MKENKKEEQAVKLGTISKDMREKAENESYEDPSYNTDKQSKEVVKEKQNLV